MDTVESVLDMSDMAPLGQTGDGMLGQDLDGILQALVLRALRGSERPAADEEAPEENPGLLGTLREMGRSGPLGELNGDIRTMLMSGALYQYSDGVPALPSVEARHMATGLGASGRGRGLLDLESSFGENFNCSIGSLPAALAGNAVFGLQRSLDGLAEEVCSTGPSPSDQGPLLEALQAEHSTPGSETSEIRMLESNLILSQLGAEDNAPRAASQSPGGSAGDAAASTMGSSLGEPHVRLDTPHVPGVLDATSSVASIGGPEELVDSMDSSHTVNHETFDHPLRFGLGSNEFFRSLNSELTPEGGLDGGLVALLRRLALGGSYEASELSDSFGRSINRLLQLGTCLSGKRLSEEQIRALPKVRFEQKEEQSCAICLEAYQTGDLLTALPCAHFFHVDCVTRWLSQSPLCRAQCVEE